MARLLLRDLSPATNYIIQVRAVADDAVSEWSRAFPLSTPNDTIPPSVPVWAAANPFVSQDDFFVATWLPVDDQNQNNLDFSHYEVEITTGQKTRIVKTNNTSYTLSFDSNRAFFGQPSGTINMRVRSVDFTGNASAWNTKLTASNPAPEAPAGISVEALTESVAINWVAVADYDLNSYKVQLSRGTVGGPYSDVYNGPNTSYVHKSTIFNQNHFYRVYAVDKFGTMSAPVVSSAVIPKLSFEPDVTPPNTPTGFSATLVNNANGIGSRANLAWTLANAPTDLQGFVVRYRKAGDTLWTSASFSYDQRDGFIELQSAYSNHEFQIKAYDFSGNESAWSSLVTATSPSNTAPPAVSGFAGVSDRTAIRYNWNAVSAADLKYYEIQFSTSSTFSSGNFTFLATGTTQVVSGLDVDTNYYARIRSVDVPGLTSAWSSAVTVKTKAEITADDLGVPTNDEFNTSVKSYSVEYAMNSSQTTAPASGWSTTAPTRTPGSYIWTRTVVTKQDNTTSTTSPVLVTGNDGATGPQGPQGVQGSQGVQGPAGADGTPRYTWIKYADTPTTGMSDSPTGKTYMGIAYNKTTPTESSVYGDYEWTLVKGETGPQGPQGSAGKGISSTAVTYQKHTNGTTAPTGTWSGAIPATVAGEFLWTRTITTYTDSATSTAYSVSAHGAQGPQGNTGSTGPQGPAGNGITGTVVTYQVAASGTTTPGGTWLTSIPSVPEGQYLWTRTVTSYNTGNPTTAYSVARNGVNGAQGIPGPAGADGQTTYTWVKYATSASGSTMSDDPNGMTYIGLAYNKTTAVESTNPSDYQWALIQGPQGPTGPTGKGVSSVTDYYYQSNEGNAAPAKPTTLNPVSGWVTTEPAYAVGKQLHQTTRTVYSDNSFSYVDVTLSSSYEAAKASSMTYIQTSAPTPGRTQDLWIDTTNGKNIPKRWSNNAWVEASDQKAIETATAAAVGDVKSMWGHPSNTTLIDGGDIYTGSVSANKIMVSDWTNILPLNDKTDGLAGYGAWSTQVVGGWNRRVPNIGSGDTYYMFNRQTQVDELPFKTGDSILIEFEIKSDVALPAATYIWTYGSATRTQPVGAISIGTTPTKISQSVNLTIDTNGQTSFLIGIHSAALSGKNVEVRNVRARRMSGGELIVDGSIQANKITAGTFTGGNFIVGTGGAVQSSNYSSGSTGWRLADGSLEINGGSIKVGAVSGLQTTLDNLDRNDKVVIGNAQRKFLNVLNTGFNINGAVGSMVIKTPILFAANMTRVQITGYNYSGNGREINFSTGFYAYKTGSTPSFPQTECNNYGTLNLSCRLARDANERVVIILDHPAGAWHYTKLSIPEVIIGNSSAPDSWASGWSVALESDLSAYTIMNTPAVRDLDDNFDVTETWRTPSNRTEINGGKITTDTIDVIKLKANSIFTQNLAVGSTFTVGTSNREGTIQSSDYEAGVRGWRLNKTDGLELNKGVIKADTIRAGNLGGPSGTNSLIQLTLGTSLVTNGGYIKSNTPNDGANAVTSFATAVNNGTGWYLGNDGLFVGTGGKIKANALESDELSGTTITLSNTGVIRNESGTLSISGAGITIPDGTLSASKMNMQTGTNIMPPVVADFEYNGVYSNLPASSALQTCVLQGVAITDSSTSSKFGSQSFAVSLNNPSGSTVVALARSATDYNVAVSGGSKYIVSAYAWTPSATNTNLQLKVKYDNGTVMVPLGSNHTASLPAYGGPNGAVRLHGTVVIPDTVSRMMVLLESSTNVQWAGFNVDGVQVEVKNSNADTPSPFNIQTQTLIDGGLIKTGAISSNANGSYLRVMPQYDENGQINGFLEPVSEVDTARRAWRIDSDGSAEFSNMSVLGTVTVGDPKANVEETYNLGFKGQITSGQNRLSYEAPHVSGIAVTFKTADIGATVTGPGIPDNTTVASIDYANGVAVLSKNATATSNPYNNTFFISRPSRVVSAIRSANYSPGETGWIARSDGTAEFLDLAAQSIDGAAIKAGTLSADKIASGELDADLVLAGKIITGGRDEDSEMLSVRTAEDTFFLISLGRAFTQSDIGKTVTSPNLEDGTVITSIHISSANTAIVNKHPTNTGDTTAYLGTAKRRVEISESGIQLVGSGDEVIVSLPTDMAQPAKFSGSIDTDDMLVRDSFLMYGSQNALGSGSRLELRAGLYAPEKAPAISFSYASKEAKLANGTPFNTVTGNGGINRFYDLVFDQYQQVYYALRVSVTGSVMGVPVFGAVLYRFNKSGVLQTTINLTYLAGTSAPFAPVAMDITSASIHFLGKYGGEWKFVTVPKSKFTSSTTNIIKDNTITTVNWTNAGNMAGQPGMAVYGGNTYIAKVLDSTNRMRILKYVGVGTSGAMTYWDASPTVTGNVASMQIGKFDYGSDHMVLTTKDGTAGQRNNYVFRATSLANHTWARTDYNFPLPANTNNSGTTWVLDAASFSGSNNGTDTAAGKFVTLTEGGRLYDYTALAATDTSTKVYSSQKWVDYSTGKVSKESSVSSATIVRRARLTLRSQTNPPGLSALTGSNPDTARFYLGTVNTSTGRRRMAALARFGMEATYSTLPAAASGGEVEMPAESPSRIVSPNEALHISGDGTIKASYIQSLGTAKSLTAETQNVNSPTGAWLWLNALGQSGATGATMGTTIAHDFRVNYNGATGGGIADYAERGSNVTAVFNSSGKLVKTGSSIRYKENLEPITLEVAKRVLDLEPVTFTMKADSEVPIEDRVRYPGFIAEQAESIGATDWVIYSVDENPIPDGFRYAELTTAHNLLIKDHERKVADLEARLEALEALLAAE